MTGPLILKDNPAENLEAVTKQYVDNHTSDVVLYTPQTLTDAQQTQVRTNINAAPGGFGLGVAGGQPLSATDDLDTVTKNGVYQWSSSLPKNAPTGYCKMRVWNGADWISQEIMSAYANEKDSIRRRVFNNNVWGPFEWVNPPMELGIEYRTTERYRGKPVYAKLIDCGTIPAQGTYKTLAFSSDEPGVIVSVIAYSGMRGTTLPYYDTNGTKYSIAGNGSSIVIWNYSEPSLDTGVYALVKYTKATN